MSLQYPGGDLVGGEHIVNEKFYVTFPMKKCAGRYIPRNDGTGTLDLNENNHLADNYCVVIADNLNHARNTVIATIGYSFAFIYTQAEWTDIEDAFKQDGGTGLKEIPL